eukprot:2155835-Karenia_brevis.AAC.1
MSRLDMCGIQDCAWGCQAPGLCLLRLSKAVFKIELLAYIGLLKMCGLQKMVFKIELLVDIGLLKSGLHGIQVGAWGCQAPGLYVVPWLDTASIRECAWGC